MQQNFTIPPHIYKSPWCSISAHSIVRPCRNAVKTLYELAVKTVHVSAVETLHEPAVETLPESAVDILHESADATLHELDENHTCDSNGSVPVGSSCQYFDIGSGDLNDVNGHDKTYTKLCFRCRAKAKSISCVSASLYSGQKQ